MVSGFGKSFALVVHRARTDGIHVAPISFFLRMLQRIAVAFRGRGDEIFRAIFARDFERVKSSNRPHLERGDSVQGVVHGAGWAGEVENIIYRAAIEGVD